MNQQNRTQDSVPPLKGVRALELAEIWAGPYCGCLLADMGAEVIKIESIQRISRGPISPPKGSSGYPEYEPGLRPWNRQANFNSTNRNKMGITLDLKTPEGANTFRDLAKASDIIFCNYARNVMDGFGLGYEAIKKIKPDIIYMLMPGYGNTGPYKDYRSMGMAIDAISSHSFLRGYPDLEQSSNSLVHHPDAVAAVNGVLAITTALIHREQTGQGQFIDMSQAESFMTHLGEIYIESQMRGTPRKRRGNRNPGYAPQGVYRCSGTDNWIAISIVNEDQWKSFVNIADIDEIRDIKYSTVKGRLESHDVLDFHIENWTSTNDRYELMGKLQDNGIPAGVVMDCGADTYADPHLNDREFFQIVDHPDAGIFPMSGPVIRFASQKDIIRHEPSPTLGQHNEYVLGDILGYDQSHIDDLKREEIIGITPLLGADLGGSRRAAEELKRQKSNEN